MTWKPQCMCDDCEPDDRAGWPGYACSADLERDAYLAGLEAAAREGK